MNNCQPLSTVAHRLNVSEADLMDFERLRWISCVKRNGAIFLSSRDEYKAKFILYLRRVDLTDEEIGQVMDAEEPPYSLARIPKIIGRPVGLSPVNASTAIGKSGFADRD
jgi:hypothetical protein